MSERYGFYHSNCVRVFACAYALHSVSTLCERTNAQRICINILQNAGTILCVCPSRMLPQLAVALVNCQCYGAADGRQRMGRPIQIDSQPDDAGIATHP